MNGLEIRKCLDEFEKNNIPSDYAWIFVDPLKDVYDDNEKTLGQAGRSGVACLDGRIELSVWNDHVKYANLIRSFFNDEALEVRLYEKTAATRVAVQQHNRLYYVRVKTYLREAYEFNPRDFCLRLTKRAIDAYLKRPVSSFETFAKTQN